MAVVLTLLLAASCKPRDDGARSSAQAPGPSSAEIAAVRDTLTRGMEPIAFANLTAAHVGKPCVVTARAADESAGGNTAPPPLGMVHRLGPTTIYKGEIQEVSADRLKIRAAYPTSGRYKTVEIRRTDVQSLHVAKSE
jgi:hypothetical protein